jgi:AraC-like DNA-binding protein
MPHRVFVRYLEIGDDLFEAPLYLTSAGRGHIARGTAYPPPGHPSTYAFKWSEGRVLPDFSLHLILEGRGEWETREGRWTLGSGQLAQIFAGEWHRFRPDPWTGWTECWLQFSGRLAYELRRLQILDASRPVQRAPGKSFIARFHELLDHVAGGAPNSAALGLQLAGLLGMLSANDHPVERPRERTSPVEQALDYIWSHSHRTLDVEEVAAGIGQKRRTLERAFRAERNATILDEIRRCRMNRAERLLRDTDLPVKNIVELAGYGTAEQLRTHFLERHDRPPRQYRREG